jgi:thioredoxin-related protein
MFVLPTQNTTQLFKNKNPIITVSRMSDIEEITITLAEQYSHILSDETKLILVLTKEEIYYPELVDRVTKISSLFPETLKKKIYKTHPDDNVETIINSVVEHILYTEHFWAKYYHDAIIIYNIKKFSEQLKNNPN